MSKRTISLVIGLVAIVVVIGLARTKSDPTSPAEFVASSRSYVLEQRLQAAAKKRAGQPAEYHYVAGPSVVPSGGERMAP